MICTISNQAVNLSPQAGIAAIIVGDDWDNTEWTPILKHAPRLQYLSTAYGPTRSDLAEALALVGATGAALAGLAALDRGADALWAAHNRGKRFEDIPGRRGAR